MSVHMQEAVEMSAENEQTASPNQPEEEIAAPAAADQDGAAADVSEEPGSELALPGWSVVSFEGVAVSGLSYEEARGWVEKLNGQKISGLCIVTDEAAARMSG